MNLNNKTNRILVNFSLIFMVFVGTANLHAGKTNQSLYEDSFDVGAGGATLTWATREGLLFANPAQLSYGCKFFRWLGLKSTVAVGTGSINLARKLSTAVDQPPSEEAEESPGEEEGGSGDILQELFDSPIHLGVSQTASFITQRGGLAVFASASPDIRAYKRGDISDGSGTPQVVIRNEAYAGAIGSLATLSPWRWLSLGLSGKYLLVNDPMVSIDFTDTQNFEKISDEISSLADVSQFREGLGVDGSMLAFFQGRSVDLRLAAALIDIGDTSIGQGEEGQTLPQMLHSGIGVTFHTRQDAFHLALDFRDVLNAHHEEPFKRVYAGVKLLLRTYVGLGFGVYHGSPSFGAEIDLIFLRVAASVYTREYGHRPGIDPRPVAMVSIATGFDF